MGTGLPRRTAGPERQIEIHRGARSGSAPQAAAWRPGRVHPDVWMGDIERFSRSLGGTPRFGPTPPADVLAPCCEEPASAGTARRARTEQPTWDLPGGRGGGKGITTGTARTPAPPRPTKRSAGRTCGGRESSGATRRDADACGADSERGPTGGWRGRRSYEPEALFAPVAGGLVGLELRAARDAAAAQGALGLAGAEPGTDGAGPTGETAER